MQATCRTFPDRPWRGRTNGCSEGRSARRDGGRWGDL